MVAVYNGSVLSECFDGSSGSCMDIKLFRLIREPFGTPAPPLEPDESSELQCGLWFTVASDWTLKRTIVLHAPTGMFILTPMDVEARTELYEVRIVSKTCGFGGVSTVIFVISNSCFHPACASTQFSPEGGRKHTYNKSKRDIIIDNVHYTICLLLGCSYDVNCI